MFSLSLGPPLNWAFNQFSPVLACLKNKKKTSERYRENNNEN